MADSIFEGSIIIGNPISGGSANQILFGDGSSNADQSPDLFFDATQKIFRVWDVSSTANDTLFTVNDVTYEIRWTATDWTNTNSIFVNNNGVGFSADEIVSWDWVSFSAIPTQGTLVCTDFSSQDQARISVNWSWAAFIQWTNWVTSASWSVFATKASSTVSFYDWTTVTNWLIVNGTNLRIGNYDASGNSTLITVDDTNRKILINNRFEQDKWADIAAANDLTLGWDWNLFVITGNTQINAITTANRQAGSMITLIFTGTPTVKHNTAWWAGTAVLLLAGSVDLTAAANTVLWLIYDGTQRQQTFVKVA